MKRFKYGFIASFILFAFYGCILAPVIDSVSKVGVTSGDRKALLEKRLKDFNEALYWGRPEEAMAYVSSESRAEMSKQLRAEGKGRRLVESKIEWVEFNDSTFEASVDVLVKYFEEPVYVVQTRKESQVWQFGFRNGWLLKSREVSKG